MGLGGAGGSGPAWQQQGGGFVPTSRCRQKKVRGEGSSGAHPHCAVPGLEITLGQMLPVLCQVCPLVLPAPPSPSLPSHHGTNILPPPVGPWARHPTLQGGLAGLWLGGRVFLGQGRGLSAPGEALPRLGAAMG